MTILQNNSHVGKALSICLMCCCCIWHANMVSCSWADPRMRAIADSEVSYSKFIQGGRQATTPCTPVVFVFFKVMTSLEGSCTEHCLMSAHAPRVAASSSAALLESAYPSAGSIHIRSEFLAPWYSAWRLIASLDKRKFLTALLKTCDQIRLCTETTIASLLLDPFMCVQYVLD